MNVKMVMNFFCEIVFEEVLWFWEVGYVKEVVVVSMGGF